MSSPVRVVARAGTIKIIRAESSSALRVVARSPEALRVKVRAASEALRVQVRSPSADAPRVKVNAILRVVETGSGGSPGSPDDGFF